MVVNVMKWRPRPPLNSRKYDASIIVRSLKGVAEIGREAANRGRSSSPEGGLTKLTVEIRWKGSKSNGLKALSRKVKRSCTREEHVGQNGAVQWNEEFKDVCSFSGYNYKDGCFNPWEVEFIVFNASDMKQKRKAVVAGPTILNLADFTSIVNGEQEIEIDLPLARSSCIDCNPSLSLTLHLTEPRTNQEPLSAPLSPLSAPLSPCLTPERAKKNDTSTLKKSLRKVKSLTEYVSSRRKSKKGYHVEASSDSKFSTGSENSETNYLFDSDSVEYSEEGFVEEKKEISDNVAQSSYGYGTVISANLAGGVFDLKKSGEDEDLVFSSQNDDSEVPDQILKISPNSKLGILKWKNRKLSFKSMKVRGEPLLKKEYGDSGGDDIDFDRRQLSSSDEPFLQQRRREEDLLSRSEFGDDMFAVGSWERKEIVNRDGSMKLEAQVFFSTIDQRNEKAAGESACTALVAVIADWLHSNPGLMPTRSEFDALIREGSFQWRSLCEVESYMNRFPDKHFDLETIIQAKIKPISVVADRSFIGFFHPEGLKEEEEGLGFLKEAMSFDNIWDEISHIASACVEPLIYIVSWNDHFFALKIDVDAYYVIDTLGERLFEGCNQAYVLKFDKDTTICTIPIRPSKEVKKNKKSKTAIDECCGEVHEEEDDVVCKGKETCKEYIKSFLSAIPIRELQADIKNGRMGSVPLHHRLQIEFHHTIFVPTAKITGYIANEDEEPNLTLLDLKI